VTLFASSAPGVTLDRVRQLIEQNLPEGLTLEYKEAYSSSLVKSVAAMANSYGGIILVGVRDGAGADRIAGVSEEAIVQIINACHDSLAPPWEPEVIPLQLDDGSDNLVLVVRVDPARAPRPLLLNGAAPVRLQGRNAVADSHRLAALFGEDHPSALARQRMQQPVLPTRTDGSSDADLVLRSGFWVPLGDAASWRPLPDSGVDRLKEVLNKSALGQMLGRWAGLLGVPGLNPFERKGFNRARRARLVWQAVASGPVTYPVEAVADLVLPQSYGYADSLSFTVDIVMRVRALAEVAKANGFPVISPWRIAVADLYATVDGLLEGLTDDGVVQALADVAGIDPAIVPQPLSAHLITEAAVEDLLHLDGLVLIKGAGGSHGANLAADPTRDLADWADRHGQIDAWMQQIALDAGLRGMEQLLARLKSSDTPPFQRP
jgi:hypothetical protein